MKISDIVQGIEGATISGATDPEITSVHYDSREVRPEGLFVAIRGLQADGHEYIDDAIQKGATAVVVENGWTGACDCPVIRTPNSRVALSHIGATFYGNPSADRCIVGVTGTNSKTTTSYLTEDILDAAGFNVGVIGTINYRFNGKVYPNPMTTPEALDIQKLLREMVQNGVTHVVMEVSSHGLDLHRVDHCWFDVGVFTNLSQEHLDYHKSMEAYFECKKRLFVELLARGPKRNKAVAVINRDDSRGKLIAEELTLPCLYVGYSQESTIWSENIKTTPECTSGIIRMPKGMLSFQSHLVGRYNVHNILSATGVSAALDIPLDSIKRGISQVHRIPGRLEPVENDLGITILVDYAHTPDALEHVLSALRELTPGRLVTIFGCGGDRDRKKRPLMGEVVGRLSDLAVVTSDNPRTESPDAIIESIIAGIKPVSTKEYSASDLKNGFDKSGYIVIPDRKSAIIEGIRVARSQDTVLIAGKGHETHQIIGKDLLPFDDHQVAKEAVENMMS
ncbi:MAG: UDP-N-acetylmuramoyl-L-alanyl-D-glutamate--2,6-diaminopimelate ligase [Deltaproteobacteria bacterium]|nr:UDP-N-acetylmuramoyl-L-alanyl-D-glutamate--2,6-diaminopimelate ligase [Deltaproteobacteria bacterium]